MVQRYCLFLKPPKNFGFFSREYNSKGARITANLVCYITNQITKIDLCKKNKRKIQITDAKVRGFLADSKKLA